MSRIYNFSAGPSTLPEPVLERVQEELVDYRGFGMSAMESSHRAAPFLDIARKADADLRQLLGIPGNSKVLYLQGGARQQFVLAPMNFLGQSKQLDYVDTGYWSGLAIQEARRYSEINVIQAGYSEAGLRGIRPQSEWRLDAQSAYVHYTPNETIGGVEFHWSPETGAVPLIADMSSTILSRPIDVSRFGMIYAGAQKNVGPAGLTLVIVREDLLRDVSANVPDIFSYKVHADNESMYNTPPTFAWYVAGLVFEWLLDEGGLEAMAERNQRKAAKLYQAIDASGFYRNDVAKDSRSWMNLTFSLADNALEKAFLKGAAEAGLKNLEGHRSVGGMRASIYNAMPEAGVDALIDYLKDFERRA